MSRIKAKWAGAEEVLTPHRPFRPTLTSHRRKRSLRSRLLPSLTLTPAAAASSTSPSADAAAAAATTTTTSAPGGKAARMLSVFSQALPGKGRKSKSKERRVVQAGEMSFGWMFKILTNLALEEVYVQQNLHTLWVQQCKDLIDDMSGTTWVTISHPEEEVQQILAVGDAVVLQSAGPA
ncbi:hypothetical protein C8Q79DRAFT_1010906 [Trametes meyenii]|nr:hypothetical protein C8Q79DRAFT_1010906 [Trametes meyenii]